MKNPRRYLLSEPVRLVAGREIAARVKTRSFLVSNILTLLVVVVGGIVLAQFVGTDDGPARTSIAIQGVAPDTITAISKAAEPLGVAIDARESDDARMQAEREDVDVALVASPDGALEVYSGKSLDQSVESAIKSGAAVAALTRNLARAGVDPATVLAPPAVTVHRTDDRGEDYGQRLALSYAGTVLLFMVVLVGGLAVAMGVIEEKVSRIVEILLATITPAQLLWGKILGVGVVQIASTAVLAAAALTTASLTGLLTIPDVAFAMVGVSVVWLVLGFLFFASLYAATGAMVSRQEEINSVSWPLMLLAMGAFYASIFGVQSPDSTLIRILAWIPPFSATVEPMRVATGHATAVEVVGSALVMVVVTATAVWVAGRIYRRSVLLTGARVSWRAALGRDHTA